jgi:hypothetical protein
MIGLKYLELKYMGLRTLQNIISGDFNIKIRTKDPNIKIRTKDPKSGRKYLKILIF